MKNAFQLLEAEGATLTFALVAVFPTRTVFVPKNWLYDYVNLFGTYSKIYKLFNSLMGWEHWLLLVSFDPPIPTTAPISSLRCSLKSFVSRLSHPSLYFLKCDDKLNLQRAVFYWRLNPSFYSSFLSFWTSYLQNGTSLLIVQFCVCHLPIYFFVKWKIKERIGYFDQ